MTEQQLVVQTWALIVSIAALTFTVIAFLWTAQREHRRWLLDRQADAYIEVCRSLDDLRDGFMATKNGEPVSPKQTLDGVKVISRQEFAVFVEQDIWELLNDFYKVIAMLTTGLEPAYRRGSYNDSEHLLIHHANTMITEVTRALRQRIQKARFTWKFWNWGTAGKAAMKRARGVMKDAEEGMTEWFPDTAKLFQD